MKTFRGAYIWGEGSLHLDVLIFCLQVDRPITGGNL